MAGRAQSSVLHQADGTPNSPLRLEEFLPYRLNLVASEVSQALAEIYGRRFGISIPEWRIMATLGQFQTMTARDIGTHSRMHKTTVSRAVATLEKRQLIARRANRADLREAFLALTDGGQKMYLEIVPLARAFSEALCQSISQEEQKVFDTLLARIQDRLASTDMPFKAE